MTHSRYRLPMKKFTYFAYGSNMLTEWLQARCSSAQAIGIAVAAGHCLKFSKRSKDNSGKATLNKVGELGRKAYGVLFEINNGDLPDLDSVEGKGSGYNRFDNFSVTVLADGKQIQVKIYIASADAIDPDLKPYDWYQALVIQGALQHELPEVYIASLREFVSIADPEPNRKKRKKAINVLRRAGVEDFTQILR